MRALSHESPSVAGERNREDSVFERAPRSARQIAHAKTDTLPHLMPRALEVLEADPFVAATFYEGDLLECVLSPALDGYWLSNPRERERIETILGVARLPEDLQPSELASLRSAVERYRLRHG